MALGFVHGILRVAISMANKRGSGGDGWDMKYLIYSILFWSR